MKEYRSLLETTENTRDLGGHRVATSAAWSQLPETDAGMTDAEMTNGMSGKAGERELRYTKRGVILRSDVPTHPSERDIDFLLQHRITTIIDLRGEKEARTMPNPLSAIEAFHYYNVPLDDGVVPDSPEAVPMIYMQFTEAENMRHVFEHIAEAENGVLFHCSAGKDRTGVVAAILLLLAGVSRKDIVADHVLTREYVHERFVRFFKEHPAIDRTIVIPRESYMNGFLDRFLARYGGAEEVPVEFRCAKGGTQEGEAELCFGAGSTAEDGSENRCENGTVAARNYLRQIGLSHEQTEHIKRKLLGSLD